MTNKLNGAQHLVEALKQADVRLIFTLSGGQVLPVYDAVIGTDIRLIHTRHEAAAVYMAEAYAQTTGQIGVALLCAGPGFINGLSAMYSAKVSQTPLLVLAGDSPLNLDGQGAFQDVDQQNGAREFALASYRVERAEDMYRMAADATAQALELSGPVHLSLPEDILNQIASTNVGATATANETSNQLSTEQVSDAVVVPGPAITELFRSAKRPLIIAGPQTAHATYKLKWQDFSVKTGIPFIGLESPRGMRAPRIGDLPTILPEADLVVLMSQSPNFLLGFGNSPPFGSNTQFVYFDDDILALETAVRRLGKDRMLGVPMDGSTAITNMLCDGDNDDRSLQMNIEPDWRERVNKAIAWRPAEWKKIAAHSSPLHAASVGYQIEKFIKANPEVSLAIDGGEVGQWGQAILDCQVSIINGPSGAIGGSLPYSIAAKAARPEYPSIAWMGDGTAGFHFMEFETAIRENLAIVAIVCNDATWYAEHFMQVRDYGEERAHGCKMNPTRYDLICQAMGGYGENVLDVNEVVNAIERAIASGKPACINIAIQSIPAP